MTAPLSHPRRYLALWFPFLPIDRWRRRAASSGVGQDEPLVLTESVKGALRLAALSREALAIGLTHGLTLADARARVPGLAAAEHDPAADAAMLRRMAEACERWTPLVALASPDGLILDVTGCAHLFGGEARLRERVVGAFRRGGVSTRGALAGTPEAARALARFGLTVVVPPGRDEEAVRPLPVAALRLPEADRAALSLAGLKRIADLADRPSLPLAARFGEDLTRRLRRVLGREDRRITPLRPAPACCVEERFAEPVTHAEAIERSLRALIARAAGLLEAAGQGGRAFEASFFRTDGEVRRITVETGRPSRDASAVLRLLHERFDALADPLDPGYGFDLIRFAVPVVEPLMPVQARLDVSRPPTGFRLEMVSKRDAFPSPVRGGGGAGSGVPVPFAAPSPPALLHDGKERPDGSAVASSTTEPREDVANLDAEALGEVSDLVDRLVARFGAARVLRFEAVDSHDAFRASRVVTAFATPSRKTSWPFCEPGDPPLRPLQLFEPPQLIETLAEVPDGPPLRFRWRRVLHRVARAEGPERISAEWWRARQQPTRDYFRVEDEEGRRFWLFRAGLYGSETDAPRWYLHGLFA